jgi:hypothetical protein
MTKSDYKDRDSFLKDIKRIVTNCRTYYERSRPDYVARAEVLLQKANQLLSERSENWWRLREGNQRVNVEAEKSQNGRHVPVVRKGNTLPTAGKKRPSEGRGEKLPKTKRKLTETKDVSDEDGGTTEEDVRGD